MSRLTRDSTAEPVSRDQIIKRERGQGNAHFPSSADYDQDWQPYPVDPCSSICDDHTCCPSGLVRNLAHLLMRKSWVQVLPKQDFYSGVHSGKRENVSK